MTTPPATAPSPKPAQPTLRAPVHYISFIAGVKPETAQRLLAAVSAEIHKGAKTVYLLLQTPGGEVPSGMALYNILLGLPCDIVTHNTASVDSIGNVIFLAGKYRYACPNATFMFHGVGIDMPQGGRIEQKSAKELLGGLEAETKKISSVIETRAGFANHAEVEELFLEASTKDATYALNHGIVHDIRDVHIPANSPFVQLVL